MITPLLLLALSASAADAPKTASVVMTAKDTVLSMTAAGTVTFADLPQPRESSGFVMVDPDKKFQTVVGIGGALTDAAADVYAALPPDARAKVIRAFYDPVDGIGYTLARTHINSCDFSSATYTYVADGDKDLKTFDIAHDRQNRIPLIKAAIAAAGGKLTVFVSPWSPPAWMKDNGSMLGGGSLKPEFAQAWAEYFVKFIRAYEKEGVPIWGLTVQNETLSDQRWETCVFTAAQERDFLKNHLGPTLAKAGLGGKKIMVYDHNRDMLYQRASVILSDPAAAKFVWGLAYHWYEDWWAGAPLYDNLRRVAEAFPDKPLFHSEATEYPFDAKKLGDWSLGEQYGREMIRDFNNGSVAWTDWNVLLDMQGGPNHVQNYCFATLHADAKTGELHFTNSYAYIGHFSKFIRPGARRVATVVTRDALLSTAFLNTDGTLAVVVMNQTDKPVDYSLWIHGKGAPTSAPAHSIATFLMR